MSTDVDTERFESDQPWSGHGIATVRLSMLGPMVVTVDGQDVTLPSGRPAELLARLAIDHGRPVTTDALIDAIWADHPPTNPKNALQVTVGRLRRAVPVPKEVPFIRTGPGGYVLDAAVATDVAEVERALRLAEEASERGDNAVVVDLLARAAQLWRGEPLPEVAYHDCAQPVLVAMAELGRAVDEALVDAELEAGRHHQLIPRLEKLVTEHPLRERHWRQLGLALYRADRQADALAAIKQAKRTLAEELGLDVGPELADLEGAILRQESWLNSPTVRPRRRRTNVPAPWGRLIGRSSDLGALRDLLTTERLVVIVGPGGVGKTRIGIEAAREEFDAMDESGQVWFVDLASVTSADGLDDAVASALQLQDARASTTREQLLDSLHRRTALVVLDNCEHLVGGVSDLVEDILATCPSVRVLATSREVLAVPGAATWPIAPLRPDDAVELFLERAESASPAFRADEADAATVRRIVEQVDGLPLAVELAAARIRTLTEQELLERLGDRLRLLTGGQRPALARHQTLRAVIDWSYDLLFDDERALFEHLCVFAGEFDLRAAEAMATAAGVDRRDVVNLLGRLVDKSLVVALRSDGRSTYRILESLTDYGVERLVAAGHIEEAHRAHASHFTDIAAASAAALCGNGQIEFLRIVRRSRPDLLLALDRLHRSEPDTALRLAGSLGWVWWVTGRTREGIHHLSRALSATAARHEDRAWAASWHAYLSFLVGAPDAIERADAAADLLDDAGDGVVAAYAASLIAEIETIAGDRQRGRRLVERAVDLAVRNGETGPHVGYFTGRLALAEGRSDDAVADLTAAVDGLAALDERILQALSSSILGDLAERRGDLAEAVRRLESSLAAVADLDLDGAIASMASRLGLALLGSGRTDEAVPILEQALATSRDLGFPPTVCYSLTGCAVAAALVGESELAESSAHEAIRVAEEIGLWSHAVIAHGVATRVAIERGRLSVAAEHADRARADAERSLDPRAVANSLVSTAAVAAAHGDAQGALRSMTEAEDLRREHGLVANAYERAAHDAVVPPRSSR